MTDDIVKRLRDAEWESVLYELAADEIERLRAEVKRLDDGWTDCVWHLQSAHKAMGVWKPALVAAEADRDRLRAALEDVRERVQEIANRYHEQHFVIDTVARLLCETIPAALAGDAKPGMEGNERELEVMGGSVPASAPHRIPEAHDRAGGFKIPPVGEPWNSEDWNAGYEQGFADGRAAPPPPATEGKP